MLSTDRQQNQNLEEAGRDLLEFILEPANWVYLERLQAEPQLRPGQNPDYQRQVGPLRICASVDVTATMDVFLRIAFRGPGLTPVSAADHLEEFLRGRMPLKPNTEWQVEVDARRWIHFIRRYTSALEA
ncbi:MAG TPA: hypothetical protein VK447_15175 [Myxococcaceae bacterium]|nr:hypothetical protein [Myxococcaceae bacterium]